MNQRLNQLTGFQPLKGNHCQADCGHPALALTILSVLTKDQVQYVHYEPFLQSGVLVTHMTQKEGTPRTTSHLSP
jgi:hypothetical protein